MALLRKFFFRKPPDGLLEICDRVYGAFFYVSGFFFSFCFLFVKMMKMIGVENCQWAKSRRFMFCEF